jgi:hypothetical protein
MLPLMLHIFFSASAAGSFIQMLDARRIDDKVTALDEELDFGPISNGSLAERTVWLDEAAPLDFGDRDWIAEDESRIRSGVSSNEDRLIWIAPASAAEQAGLSWFISNFDIRKTSIAIVDFPVKSAGDQRMPLCLGELGVEAMHLLYDDCPRVPLQDSRFGEDRWNQLVAENALLRVVEGGELRSAPDEYFDALLLAHCGGKWERWYRVLADVMGDVWDSGQSAGIELLLWRLRCLIQEDRIACDGELPKFGGASENAAKIRRAS